MSSITEKRSFKIPPCNVDKELIARIGEFVQREFESYYKENYAAIKEIMEKENYYKNYPAELNDPNIKKRMGSIALSFELESDDKKIESSSVKTFVDADWPDKANEISISMRSYSNDDKRIHIQFYLDEWRTSTASVSGFDGTWVNGIADQLERVFKKKRLSYHLFVNHFSLRGIISFAAWASLSYAILFPIWPFLVPHLREGVQFITLYAIILVGGGVIAVFLFEYIWKSLFPKFEYGKNSSKTARKIIWELLISSGFISALVLYLMGL